MRLCAGVERTSSLARAGSARQRYHAVQMEHSKKRGSRFMPQHHPLTIKVNDQFTIDAGSWQECAEEDQIPYRLVSPPQTTMCHQVLSYLEEATRDQKVPPKSQLHFGEVAIATVSVCLRWGTYFAVLTNRDLPDFTPPFYPEAISFFNGEIPPLNIDPSAALPR